MEPSTIIRITILLVATVLVIVGTSVPHISLPNRTLYLYKAKYFGTSMDHEDFPGQCSTTQSRFNAAYGFAILACITIGISFILTCVSAFVIAVSKILKILSAGFTALGFISLLITLAIVINLYEAKFCDAPRALKDKGFELDSGAGLIICTWCLLFCDFVVAVLSILGIGKKE